MKNLHRLLYLLSFGNTLVAEDEKLGYKAVNTITDDLKNAKSIPSRIKYELYGEYPLSPKNQNEWDFQIESTFNLSNCYRRMVKLGIDIND